MKAPKVAIDQRYSASDPIAPTWDQITAALAGAEVYALSTVLADGTPHTVPVAGAWTEDGFVFCTGEYEQKARNISRNSRASVHIGSASFSTGMDVIARGETVHQTDEVTLTHLAQVFEGKYPEFFRFEVTDGPLLNAHGNRAEVYQLRPDAVYAFTRGDNSAQVKYTFT